MGNIFHKNTPEIIAARVSTPTSKILQDLPGVDSWCNSSKTAYIIVITIESGMSFVALKNAMQRKINSMK
jgi:hypothetical protein